MKISKNLSKTFISSLCTFCALSLMLPTLAGCSSGSPAKPPVTTEEKKNAQTTSAPAPTPESGLDTNFSKLALEALNRVLVNYWTSDKRGEHIIPTHEGKEVGRQVMVWEHAMLMLAMESYYYATGSEQVKDMFASEWEYLKDIFTHRQLTGNQGEGPNAAADDAGWGAMLYIATHRITGDESALDYARELIYSSFDYWKDGDLSNGMFYTLKKDGGLQRKSIYCAAFVIAAFDYLECTKGTEKYDENLLSEAMKLYGSLERLFCRDGIKEYENCFQNGDDYTSYVDDHLYWCDYFENNVGNGIKNGPDGVDRPDCIYFRNSISSMFGNQAMAAINAKLYKMTGEEKYKEKALATTASMARIYNNGGVLLNDRDTWTNGAFLYYFVTEVLTLDGVDTDYTKLLFKTAEIVAEYCYDEESGHYYSDWSKYPEVLSADLMNDATNISVICAAALAQSLGLDRGLGK